MITLDANLIFQSNFYELKTKRKNLKAHKNIDDYPESQVKNTSSSSSNSIDTSNNNTKKASDYTSVDIKSILEALKLYVPKNRFRILMSLPLTQLIRMLGLLDKDKLAVGLKFFSKEKLRKFIYELPKDKILKMLLKLYSKEEILQMFPIKELRHFLSTDKIKQRDLLCVFEIMPKNVLAQIYESITGIPSGSQSKDDLLNNLKKFDKNLLVEGVKSLPHKEMLKIIHLLTKQNEELFKEFSHEALYAPFETMTKPTIIDSAKALEPEDLIKMLSILPQEFMALTLAQIDPNELTYQLEKNNSDLLISLVQ